MVRLNHQDFCISPCYNIYILTYNIGLFQVPCGVSGLLDFYKVRQVEPIWNSSDDKGSYYLFFGVLFYLGYIYTNVNCFYIMLVIVLEKLIVSLLFSRKKHC